MLKAGEDTRNPLHHMSVSGHPVMADIRIPGWVDWNRDRAAIRRLCRDPRRGVPRTPVIGTGMVAKSLNAAANLALEHNET